MTKTRIVLAYAADAKALAALAERRLSGLGFSVDRRVIDKLNGAAEMADRVIVLWSRGVANAGPDLKRAEDSGKLCIVRLASQPTPPRLRAHLAALPRPRDSDAAWRALAGERLVKIAADRAEPNAHPGSRWHALLVALLMGLVVTGAVYAVR